LPRFNKKQTKKSQTNMQTLLQKETFQDLGF
jgi:hypothetical protein